jgi:hypothetical protein
LSRIGRSGRALAPLGLVAGAEPLVALDREGSGRR